MPDVCKEVAGLIGIIEFFVFINNRIAGKLKKRAIIIKRAPIIENAEV